MAPSRIAAGRIDYLFAPLRATFFLVFLPAGAEPFDFAPIFAPPLLPKAASQPSEYFFVVPTRTIVTVVPFIYTCQSPSHHAMSTSSVVTKDCAAVKCLRA